MKQWVVRVKDKSQARSLAEYGNIIFISKYINTVAVEASEANAKKIANHSNVISIRPSKEGCFQLA